MLPLHRAPQTRASTTELHGRTHTLLVKVPSVPRATRNQRFVEEMQPRVLRAVYTIRRMGSVARAVSDLWERVYCLGVLALVISLFFADTDDMLFEVLTLFPPVQVSETDGPGGCIDIDECAAIDDPCAALNKAAFEAKEDKNSTDNPRFCLNKPGSFECADCSPACVPLDPAGEGAASCTGPHPADCRECADGWEVSEKGGCKDVDECAAGHKCDAEHYCQNTDGSVSCLK